MFETGGGGGGGLRSTDVEKTADWGNDSIVNSEYAQGYDGGPIENIANVKRATSYPVGADEIVFLSRCGFGGRYLFESHRSVTKFHR